MTALILDNFLPYPNVVRTWAINQTFYNAKEFTEKYNAHSDWPGRRTEHVLTLDTSYANVILRQIAGLANKHFNLDNISIKSYFQLTIPEDGDSWVHQDNDTDMAVLLYLNPNPPKNSGTTLYHCNDVTKWESFMSSAGGYDTLKQINRVEKKDLYDELFTPIDSIGNVFNRLVFYPGTAYHKSNDYFGDSIETGRLTQVFFITQDK